MLGLFTWAQGALERNIWIAITLWVHCAYAVTSCIERSIALDGGGREGRWWKERKGGGKGKEKGREGGREGGRKEEGGKRDIKKASDAVFQWCINLSLHMAFCCHYAYPTARVAGAEARTTELHTQANVVKQRSTIVIHQTRAGAWKWWPAMLRMTNTGQQCGV